MTQDKVTREASLVFPNQLYEAGPPGGNSEKVYLLEARRFFSDFPFQKKKLLFHRATMKTYAGDLAERGFQVEYLDFRQERTLTEFFKTVAGAGVNLLHYYDPVDHKLRDELKRAEERSDITLKTHPLPGFTAEVDQFRELFPDENYRMAGFYRKQRKRLDLLIEDGKPRGGKWSYDSENRRALPDQLEVPDLPSLSRGKGFQAAVEYIEKRFPKRPGDTDDFVYPVSQEEAESWLEDFFENRFKNFGAYQDAISRDETFIFHSILSPLLNVGLLTPLEIVNRAIKVYEKNSKIELNSLEGFIRQIIGWREYVRLIYEIEGTRQKNSNYWSHEKSMPESFYTGETGIPPVDKSVTRLRKFGYLHHIERLMVVGNFALLCEIDPDEVYRWFMELSIDAYDWVMTPNVYGMSQYADGGLIMTKPYISSSNYIRKMSDYPAGEWCDTWDGLYWRFVDKHSEEIGQIPRMAVMKSQLERMNDEKVSDHWKNAENFLDRLFSS